MGPYAAVIACSVIVAIGVVLILLMDRRFRRIEEMLERQQRLIEGISSTGTLMPRPLSARIERRTEGAATPRTEPSPRGVSRLEPTHRSATRPEGSPRATPRIETSPRGVPRLPESSPTANRQLDAPFVRTPAGWTPSHRITFTKEQGRSDSWLVMMMAGPDGGRLAATKSEWSAGVQPAWRCTSEGVWTFHGQATPDGARGRVTIEDFTPT